jgi:hypothetical protein
MATPTIQIKQDLDRKLQRIRSNGDLSEEAKRRYIAEAYEKAERDYREAIDTQQRAITERVSSAERRLFEPRYLAAASDSEKRQIRAARRAAYESDYYSTSLGNERYAQEQLELLLQRVERSGDPELAEAVYHVATEKGIRKVADSYLENRPEEKRLWDAYVAAHQEAESPTRPLDHAMMFGLKRPPDLTGGRPELNRSRTGRQGTRGESGVQTDGGGMAARAYERVLSSSHHLPPGEVTS